MKRVIVESTLSFIIGSFFLAQSAFSEPVCIDPGPTKECMDYIYSDVGYNKVKAAQACSGAVSIECIGYIYSDAGYNKAKAAEYCKGGVTKECIDYIYSDAGYNKVKAAQICGGRG